MSVEIAEAVAGRGWTTVDGVLGAAAVDDARRGLDEVFAAEDDIADERGWRTATYRVSYALPVKDRRFVELATAPQVLAIARSVLGDDCVLAACNGIDLVPGGPAQRLHRDHPDPVDATTLFVHIVVALDDFTEDNGATVVLSGSHRGPWAPEAPTPAVPIAATVPAGGAVVYDGCLVHGAGANNTDGRRRALHLFFARWWVRPHWDLDADLTDEVRASMSAEQRRAFGAELRPRRFDVGRRRTVR